MGLLSVDEELEGVLVVLGDEEESSVEEDDEADEDELPLLSLLLLVARAPVPQGMFSPSGCFDSVGSVVSPLAPAMVKRVVQVG